MTHIINHKTYILALLHYYPRGLSKKKVCCIDKDIDTDTIKLWLHIFDIFLWKFLLVLGNIVVLESSKHELVHQPELVH